MGEKDQDETRAEAGGRAVADLMRLMDRLRTDCPWDRKQTLADLHGYLLEECYEALDALARRDLPELEGELGDLLFQIVFQARLGREEGAFDLESVARRIHAKLVSRHPHVFGASQVADADAVRVQWEALKKKERGKGSPFSGLPAALPALLKAARLTSRAADLGFDWRRDGDVLEKLDEEVRELRAELESDSPKERKAEELGDILFTVVNVARRLGIDPEAALQATNAKFIRRFEAVAARVEESGREVSGTPLEELDHLWDEVKTAERS